MPAGFIMGGNLMISEVSDHKVNKNIRHEHNSGLTQILSVRNKLSFPTLVLTTYSLFEEYLYRYYWRLRKV